MNDSRVVNVKQNAQNLWNEFLEWFEHVKETASQMTNPGLLGEQLQIIFRDESK